MESKPPPKSPILDGKQAFAKTTTTRHHATTSDAHMAALHAHAHRICPGCGMELVDRGCKMRCLRCGFFLDCSDG